MLSCAQLCVFDTLHNTREWFNERRVAELSFRLEAQEIFLDEPRGNNDGLGVGTVQEKEIFT